MLSPSRNGIIFPDRLFALIVLWLSFVRFSRALSIILALSRGGSRNGPGPIGVRRRRLPAANCRQLIRRLENSGWT